MSWLRRTAPQTVKPCLPPAHAVVVEDVAGQVEIPYSSKNRRWHLCQDGSGVYLSERPGPVTLAVVSVPHHAATIFAEDIKNLLKQDSQS